MQGDNVAENRQCQQDRHFRYLGGIDPGHDGDGNVMFSGRFDVNDVVTDPPPLDEFGSMQFLDGLFSDLQRPENNVIGIWEFVVFISCRNKK